MEDRTQYLIRLLPYAIRDKARGYLGYVHDRLVDLALEEGVYGRIKEIRGQVGLIFLLRLLYGYFVIGYRNYRQMLDFFEDKGVEGFQIGSAVYTRQSQTTFQWQEIAAELESLLADAGIASYVRPSLSVDEVLQRIIDSLPDESQSVGRPE